MLKEEQLFMAITNTSSKIDDETWLLDSAASNHMTPNEYVFTSLDRSLSTRVLIGNTEWLAAIGMGIVKIHIFSGAKFVHDVYFLPEICQNLLSLGQLVEQRYALHFEDLKCDIYDEHKVIL